jgi:hypothetical protein
MTVKDIDFLPEWYKEGHRHRVHMRHQYAVLAAVVCAMITYNVAATHRINRISASIDGLDDQRRIAEQVIYEYDVTNKQLQERQAKVDLIAQMDSKIDVSAVLAELSHIINGSVVLSRLDFISETVDTPKEPSPSSTTVRPADASGTGKYVPLGDVRFRIVMAGVAANPADVGTLACRLEESPYFRQVYPSVSRSSKIEMAAPAAAPPTARADSVQTEQGKETLQASEFEITCYLANYEESKGG